MQLQNSVTYNYNYISNKRLLTASYSVTYNYVAKHNLDLQYKGLLTNYLPT